MKKWSSSAQWQGCRTVLGSQWHNWKFQILRINFLFRIDFPFNNNNFFFKMKFPSEIFVCCPSSPGLPITEVCTTPATPGSSSEDPSGRDLQEMFPLATHQQSTHPEISHSIFPPEHLPSVNSSTAVAPQTPCRSKLAEAISGSL